MSEQMLQELRDYHELRDKLIKVVEEEIPVYGIPMLGRPECQAFIKAFDNWVWKLREVISPNSECPTCKKRDDCIDVVNPHQVDFCCNKASLTSDIKRRGTT